MIKVELELSEAKVMVLIAALDARSKALREAWQEGEKSLRLGLLFQADYLDSVSQKLLKEVGQ